MTIATRALVFVLALLLIIMVLSIAYAADEVVCARYGVQVERLILYLTNDQDVSQAARYRAEAYCGVIDDPPKLQLDPSAGTAPASDAPIKASVPKFPAEWIKKCRSRYRSFRETDGTVLKPHRKTRQPCPVAK